MRTPYSISPCALGISGYLVKLRMDMPNAVSFGLAMFAPLMIPSPRRRGEGESRRIAPVRVELAQHVQLFLARRLDRLELGSTQPRKAGVVLHLLTGDTVLQR